MRAALEACHKGWCVRAAIAGHVLAVHALSDATRACFRGQSCIIGVAAGGEEISTRPFQVRILRVHIQSSSHALRGCATTHPRRSS